MTTQEALHAMVSEAVQGILSVISDDLQGMSLDRIVQTTQEAVNRLGVEIVRYVVNVCDEAYNGRRDKHAVLLRHTKTRRLASAMGEIELTRRLYFDKLTGRYFFAVDELLNIEKYSRIESGLKKKLISDATLTSYGKASKLSGNAVSRQTVSNLCKSIDARHLLAKVNRLKKAEKLYIEADEDHIHLKRGKDAEVKLVYVHEGRRERQGRMELVNPKYFAALCDGPVMWEMVADYVYAQYAVRNRNITISGDGARWIKAGLDAFPGAQFVLDKFHVYKSVTDAASGSAKFRRQVIEGLKRADRNGVLKLYAEKQVREPRRLKRKRMAESFAYLDNNFDNIDLSSARGCSAEGHVSHVLSARMSARPMAWSQAGADKMARLRAFYFNGGSFSELTLKKATAERQGKRRWNTVLKDAAFNGDSSFAHILADGEVLKKIRELLYRKPEL